MKTARVEAFSDGVIAIIITIMVLEMKVPHDSNYESLVAVVPHFLSYALSFLMIAIYWVNHHQLIHLVRTVDRPMLWANIVLLFCLSLFPFATAHLGQSHAASYAMTLYVCVALASATAYYWLRYLVSIHCHERPELAHLHASMRRKNRIAIGIYVLSLVASFVYVPASLVLVILPAAMYFLPVALPAHEPSGRAAQ